MITPCDKCQDTGRLRTYLDEITGRPPDAECECRSKKAVAGEVGDVFDALVLRSLSEQQMVERITTDFLGVSDTPEPNKHRPIPSQERVERYVGRLVEAVGSKLGGLTRKKLVSKVMAKLAARSRKRASAYWAAYYGRS